METCTWHLKKLNSDEQKLGQLIREINNLIVNFSKSKGTEADANLIVNQIWLGNFKAAHDLNFIASKGINIVINVTDSIPNKFDFVDYVTFPIKDTIACEKNIINIIEKGADIINYCITNQKPLLVHCKSGHHRSASILAFYLMKYHNMSLIQAIYLIKCIRPTAFRRINCMLQALIRYEINRIN